ncbi:MAG: hypothetical protein M1820_000052 [Bogoriella megaspora]|nr:MAG: hypothetical protein M1820_000052 [Bogoriella megaspora]
MAGVGSPQPARKRKVTTYGRASRVRNLPLPNNGSLAPVGTIIKPDVDTDSGVKSWNPPSAPGKLPTKIQKPAATQDIRVFDIPSSPEDECRITSHLHDRTSEPQDDTPRAGFPGKWEPSPDSTTSPGSSDGSRKRKRRTPTPSDQLQIELSTATEEFEIPSEVESEKKMARTTPMPRRQSIPRREARSPKRTIQQEKNKRQNLKKPTKVLNNSTNALSTFTSTTSAPAKLEHMVDSADNSRAAMTKTTKVGSFLKTQSGLSDSLLAGTVRHHDRTVEQVSLNPSYDPMDMTPLPSTPPRASPVRSETPSQMLLNTPRQKKIWANLLQDDFLKAGRRPIGSKHPSLTATAKVESSASSAPIHSHSIEKQLNGQTSRKTLVESLTGGKPDLDAYSTDEDDSDDSLIDEVDNLVSKSITYDQPRKQNSDVQPASSDAQGNHRMAQSRTGGARITYSTAKRTIVQPQETEIDELMLAPLDDVFGESSQQSFSGSQKESQKLSQTTDMDLEEGLEEDDGPSMRTAHELQAAGGNRRFIDDMDSLMSDINGPSARSQSAHRSALIELAQKLMTKEFLARFIHHDYDRKLFAKFTDHSDAISDFAWTVSVGLVSSGANSHVLKRMCRAKLAQSLICQIDSTQNIASVAKDRKTNMSKVARTTFIELRDMVLSAEIWGAQKPRILSPHLMSLKSLDLLVHRSRESGFMDPILDGDGVGKLARISQLPNVAMDLESRETDLETSLAVSILESDSLCLTYGKEGAWTPKILANVAATILPLLMQPVTNQNSIAMLALRLCLNLTNNKPDACDVFGEPPIVALLARSVVEVFAEPLSQMDQKERIAALDGLLLSLGLLINLAEYSEKARLSLIEDDDTLLQGLVDSFLIGRQRSSEADSIEQTQVNVAYGYLAVYLANLCENHSLRRRIRIALPGKRIEGLVAAVQEFIKMNERVDSEKLEAGEGQTPNVLTVRLQKALDRLKTSID